ncbi:MAG: ribonuclease III [bacterium]
MNKEKILAGFQKNIGISFLNPLVLEKALTHSSYDRENNNERLCFLGDSVLNMITASYLFEKFGDFSEGFLTKMKANMVSRRQLVQWARNIELGKFLFLSNGEEKTGGRKKTSILAEAIEALVGAIFIDSGIENAKLFIMKHIECHKEEILDYKSSLQEIVQRKDGSLPIYKLIEKSGQDHKPIFSVSVSVDGMVEAGKGKSKKEAEEDAARKLLKKIKREV